MLATSIPTKFQLAFGQGAGGSFIRAVPVASQIGINPGAASETDGFPPVCFIVPSAGGIPPDGRDVNGILNQATAWDLWQSVGGPVYYDAVQSTAIGGYPHGALLNAVGFDAGYWFSLVDNNTSDPDTGGANWLFIQMFNITTVVAAVNANTQFVSLTGSGTFTVPAGITKILVRTARGGGGGGGGVSSSGSQPVVAPGGSGASFSMGEITVTPGASLAYSVGAAGAGGTPTTNGGNGGATTFAGIITAPGGLGAAFGNNSTPDPSSPGPPANATGGAINRAGVTSSTGGIVGATGTGGPGGGSYGQSASNLPGIGAGPGIGGSLPGIGGNGAGANTSGSSANGGNGGAGELILEF